MKKNFALLLSIFFFVIGLLSACSNSGEVIKIDNKSFAEVLFVQKVEGRSSNEEMTKKISERAKIKEILNMVEGIKVQEAEKESLFGTLKSQNTYMFSFSKELKSAEEVPYVFYALNDGTFIFTQDKVNSSRKAPLISTERHKYLLNEIKEKLKLDF
ncbi:hypothetical protein [Halobacillus naozhouensis]|uniref:Lipoprotein n=1 Tax=Halobacillus naozhouensis TaxID=554880 RepID=A0ABY8IU41_9BACI|nr:hypothetical protein [Halobacillus naozhouensis]WFT73604.1 hypothetical protein P9989_14645 [Halobacillus naozhouensis]